jgi:hypothetical protein
MLGKVEEHGFTCDQEGMGAEEEEKRRMER